MSVGRVIVEQERVFACDCACAWALRYDDGGTDRGDGMKMGQVMEDWFCLVN